MKKVICIIFISLGFFAFSQNKEKFNQGKEHYKEANYEAAITAWESILESGEHSAALYYNLGNAYYRIDQIAPSIYFYEKALQLAPGDPEIRNNLAFAQNRTIDIIEPVPQNLISTWIQNTTQLINFDRWAVVSIAFVIGFVILFLLYYFSISTFKKRSFFTASILSLFIGIISLVFAYTSYNSIITSKTAIIFAQSSQVRGEPLQRSDISFVLHEGTKVKIISEVDDWSRIKLADGKEGWMPKGDLKKL
jgi:tetratricopeptide (TPR) repeat protein